MVHIKTEANTERLFAFFQLYVTYLYSYYMHIYNIK